MLLRESSKKAGTTETVALNLKAVTDSAAGEIGVLHEQALLEVAEAVCQGDSAVLKKVRQATVKMLGSQGLIDAIAVAAAFNGITKIANATGLPLDQSTHASTVEMRKETGIDDYSDSFKANKFELTKSFD